VDAGAAQEGGTPHEHARIRDLEGDTNHPPLFVLGKGKDRARTHAGSPESCEAHERWLSVTPPTMLASTIEVGEAK